MRRWRLVVPILIVVIVSGAVVRWHDKRAQRRRNTSYQASLRSYSEKFRPGETRKVVEDYFRAKGVPFHQELGPGSLNSWSDVVRIGQEPAPWFCNSWGVYVVFDFAATEQHDRFNGYDSDTLKTVRLSSRGETCL